MATQWYRVVGTVSGSARRSVMEAWSSYIWHCRRAGYPTGPPEWIDSCLVSAPSRRAVETARNADYLGDASVAYGG